MVAKESVVGLGDRDKGNMILGRGWSDEVRGKRVTSLFPRGRRGQTRENN